MSASFPLLLGLGLRNLRLHRVKGLVVGSLLFGATFLVVTVGALVGSIKTSMERSITSSLAGQVQVYDMNAKDTLALFPGGAMGSMDYGEIADFDAVHDALLRVEGVEDVVPMGLTNALVLGTTELDRVLDQLRSAVRAGDQASYPHLVAEVQQIATGLEAEVQNSLVASAEPDVERARLADLARIREPAFWDGLSSDPEAVLTFLESRIAPMALDGRSLYLRLIGTDLTLFPKAFDRFRLAQGELPREGESALLLSKGFYEEQAKNEVARSLDVLRAGLDEGRTLADDRLLAETARRLVDQRRRVTYQIAPDVAPEVSAALSAALGVQGDLDTLVKALLTVDDQNFRAHDRIFSEVVAPRIRLYDVLVGETVTLRSFTKNGYARAVNARLSGIFEFSGLETSDLAGANQLVDLDTFRSLYGRMSGEQQAELADIRATAGVGDLDRDDAEAALFGGAPVESSAPAPVVEAGAPSGEGLVLNAAVVFQEGRVPRDAPAVVQAALDQAGLPLQAVDWKKAAGLIGQLITVIQAVIYVGIFIIFVVSLAIINNTMMMSAMQRTGEIGTLRAIGAQRGFVVGLFLLETLMLGLAAGTAGALAGAAFVGLLGKVGIPAVADVLVLLFAGPRLYPVFSLTNLLFGLGMVVVFAVLSALQPTLMASRVSPVVAMAQKD